LLVLGGLTGLLLFSYINTLRLISNAWSAPEYSHGWLVPLFAGVLLWLRREPIGEATPIARWSGVGLLAAGLALRLAGAYVGYPYADMISLLPSLIGIFLLVGGWSLLRWSGPALGFLVFMYPLPGMLARTLLDPLQKMATIASTFALQTLGIAAYRENITIKIGEEGLNVAEACSGLRMATIFLALAVAVVLVTTRPWWERIVILLSAIPVAIAVNVIRITGTGVCYYFTKNPRIVDFVHEAAGWIMMPIAMGFLFLEFQVLVHLFLEEDAAEPMPIGVMPVGVRPARGKS
jgi:exosortase